MNDDDFWGDFAIDYSGGTDALFNFGDSGGAFDVAGALNSIGGVDTMFDAMNYLDTSWLDSIVSGLDLKGGDASWLDTFDFDALAAGLDPYEIDGLQGSRDESTALIGTGLDPYEIDGMQGSRDESTALIGTETDPYGIDGR